MIKTRWGILGCGSIARKFATGLRSVPDASLVAAGSRTQTGADTFADEFDVPNRHDSYGALASDPEVDAVYVATPHPMHRENSILCLEAGKAVLCEKPFTVNTAEAEEVVAAAARKGVFLMEAQWTRFLPTLAKLRELITKGVLGEVRMVQVDFGFRTRWNPESRVLDPVLAGGGILDVGTYTVSLANMVLGGPPEKVAAMASIGETGVDEHAAALCSWSDGRIGLLACGVRTQTPQEATIMGTEGYVRLESPWWRGSGVTLHRSGQAPESLDVPLHGNGYNYEAEEVGRCLADGKLESEIMSHKDTLDVMRTLDRIRAEVGLKFPMER